MTDYKKLVAALRCENTGDDECGSSDCPYWSGLGCMDGQLMEDAAAAIEDLEGFLAEAERDRDEYEERMRKEQERVIKLQAEVERLKDSNEELRERQTYIDHYGDKWMTSAKDVPTAAYEHGYADGRDEAEAQLPKRGEVVRCGECKHRKDSIQCPLCSEGIETADDWFCADGEREVQE